MLDGVDLDGELIRDGLRPFGARNVKLPIYDLSMNVIESAPLLFQAPNLGIDDYHQDERELLRNHDSLFEAWREFLRGCTDVTMNGQAEWMTKDGFYPYYTQQKRKILFLGRDAYGMLGCDYIDTFFKVYRWEKQIGEVGKQKHLNQHLFHARMLHVAWGILNGMPDWDMIPWAATIGDEFGTENGISFAFLNLGKTRLIEEGTHADINSIDLFCEVSAEPHDFIARQIALLGPDIVISMNLGRWLNRLGTRESLENHPDLEAYRLNAAGHECLLLNAWHFSARKSQRTQIYEPICNALRAWDANC